MVRVAVENVRILQLLRESVLLSELELQGNFDGEKTDFQWPQTIQRVKIVNAEKCG
eukprot:CAMPEP_0115027458 /NCGR_PEP_ID=MMETSP0216-20121206/35535_1 /TAXON_ID=223996 /ORGANISM="Protocruzia adherens, Strain Boccale" /LENGTH=55 /DNA_ID=CAMNT_0002403091 /DNA_START=1 /DNA_END=164 /DNA_ORIENTATION=-